MLNKINVAHFSVFDTFATKISVVMKSICRSIFFLMMAMVVFITTGGFAVFLHHCSHQNELFTSVFINNANKEHQCCSEMAAPVCCSNSETKEDESGKSDSDCCNEVVLFVRVSPDTEPVNFQNQKVEPLETEPLRQHTLFDIEEEIQLVTFAYFDHPPEDCLLYGKQLILLSHQLKLDHC